MTNEIKSAEIIDGYRIEVDGLYLNFIIYFTSESDYVEMIKETLEQWKKALKSFPFFDTLYNQLDQYMNNTTMKIETEMDTDIIMDCYKVTINLELKESDEE